MHFTLSPENYIAGLALRPKHQSPVVKRACWGFPGGSVVKNLPANAGDMGLIPGYGTNTEIRLIIFFAAKDGEALYSQQKQDWELTVAQIINFLLPNSDLN